MSYHLPKGEEMHVEMYTKLSTYRIVIKNSRSSSGFTKFSNKLLFLKKKIVCAVPRLILVVNNKRAYFWKKIINPTYDTIRR